MLTKRTRTNHTNQMKEDKDALNNSRIENMITAKENLAW